MLEHFNSCVESIEKKQTLSFLKMLDEYRRDAELNPLIDVGTWGFHTLNNLFKHGERRVIGTLRNF